MRVVAVIVLIAVLVVLIAPMVSLGPAARLVRAGHALQSLLAFLPFTFPGGIPLAGSREFQSFGSSPSESLPVVPIFKLDCVLLC
jgi:hypothetical protein